MENLGKFSEQGLLGRNLYCEKESVIQSTGKKEFQT